MPTDRSSIAIRGGRLACKPGGTSIWWFLGDKVVERQETAPNGGAPCTQVPCKSNEYGYHLRESAALPSHYLEDRSVDTACARTHLTYSRMTDPVGFGKGEDTVFCEMDRPEEWWGL